MTGSSARILGAGIGEENALWTARSFSTRGWSEGGNAGGVRTWLAPEAGPRGFFFSADGARWDVPRELDPGSYREVAAPEGPPSGLEGWLARRTGVHFLWRSLEG